MKLPNVAPRISFLPDALGIAELVAFVKLPGSYEDSM
jgi:hypothetical protein